MKRSIIAVAACFISLLMISWGFKGHRAIATIAEKHLSTDTKAIISSYLNGETMAEASTWADEIRDDQEYKNTSSWHFLNVPAGLSRAQFDDFVTKGENNNIYTAILKAEAGLKDKSADLKSKTEALKFLIHLIGDAHQPMHVSRAEDKGGNTIQLRFDDKGTNLHSLWDSKLLDHEGLNNLEMVRDYDRASPDQIKKWQADSPMQWLWEGYQISLELYKDIKPGQTIDEAYYKKSIPTIRLRVAQAGIRLAGELNRLLPEQTSATVVKSSTASLAPSIQENDIKPVVINLDQAKNSVNKLVKVKGKVYSLKDIGSMVLVNLGAAYPNQLLTIALKGKAKELAGLIHNETITVEGKIIDFKGKPEIVVSDPEKIKL